MGKLHPGAARRDTDYLAVHETSSQASEEDSALAWWLGWWWDLRLLGGDLATLELRYSARGC
jgi:hypothetical protein